MVAQIAIFLVLAGGAIGSLLRLLYLYPEVTDMEFFLLAFTLAGGAVGAFIRFMINGIVLPISGSTDFPLGTILSNILASLIVVLVYLGQVNQFYTTYFGQVFIYAVSFGLASGMSTFSTLAMDVVLLLQRRAYTKSVVYLVATLGITLGFGYVIFESFDLTGAVGENQQRRVLELNLIGCAIMGAVVAIMMRFADGGYGGTAGYIFFCTGILGSFTSYSQFMIMWVMMVSNQMMSDANIFLAQMVGGSIVAYFVAHFIVGTVLGLRRRRAF